MNARFTRRQRADETPRPSRLTPCVFALCLLVLPAGARAGDGGPGPGPRQPAAAFDRPSPGFARAEFPLETAESAVADPGLSRLMDSTVIFAATAGEAGRRAGGTARPAKPGGPAGSDPSSGPCIVCGDYWGVLKDDVKHELTSPARWNAPTWRSVGVKSLIVVGAVTLLDRRVASYIDNHKTDTTNRIADDFQPFGREYAAYVVGGFLLAGDLAHNENAKAVAVDGLSTTVIAAGLVVPALKVIAGRSRPRADQGPHDFHPLNGGHSFPSGHATAAFSVAASVAEHYDALWVKGLAYGLASMVAYARMEKDAHFLSDVTAGAMLGVGVAHSVYAFNGSRRRRVTVQPLGRPGQPGSQGAEISLELALR